MQSCPEDRQKAVSRVFVSTPGEQQEPNLYRRGCLREKLYWLFYAGNEFGGNMYLVSEEIPRTWWIHHGELCL